MPRVYTSTMRITLALLPFFLFASPGSGGEPLDKTGVRWVAPFDKALEQAKTQKRLLMIKPVAFGTAPDGGW